MNDLTPLEAIEIHVCPFLPKTVKDKDGNEVELVSVMVSRPPLFAPWEERIVLLTGDKV